MIARLRKYSQSKTQTTFGIPKTGDRDLTSDSYLLFALNFIPESHVMVRYLNFYLKNLGMLRGLGANFPELLPNKSL